MSQLPALGASASGRVAFRFLSRFSIMTAEDEIISDLKEGTHIHTVAINEKHTCTVRLVTPVSLECAPKYCYKKGMMCKPIYNYCTFLSDGMGLAHLAFEGSTAIRLLHASPILL